ncbi:MAG: hypothetical protein QOI10_3307 [Solirubrobacterales bacterium]|nr:hypothetical protein [Solirubrobacterales bacterium]
MSAEAVVTASRPWALIQKGVLAICVFQLGWATAGLIAEPSFHFGDGAPTQTVLWVDFNGVHALSGFLLFGPGLLAAARKGWALVYAYAAAGALIVTGLWALASTAPASVFSFPNNERDAVLHIGTGVLFLALALIQLRRDRAEL